MLSIGEVNHCNILFVFCLFVSILVSLDARTLYFPEQNMPNAFQLRDGQSLRNKYLIVRLMNLLERRKARQLGLSQNIPWSTRYVFEGDIILRREQALELVNRNKRRKKRKMDADVTSPEATKKWPLPINYVFVGNQSETNKKAVRQGINHWMEQTCITFTNDENSTAKTLTFIDDVGCYSYVGNDGDEKNQVISISDECATMGIVAHEIGHAIGFWHEHARPDRDDYVNIKWKNIIIGRTKNFNISFWNIINNLGIPYDYGSIMHYSSNQFAKGYHITVETLHPLLQNTIGQRQELSFFDAKLANMAYCKDVCDKTMLSAPCQNEGYQDPKNCSRCRCPEGLAGDTCELVAPSNKECGGTIEILDNNSTYTITSPGHPSSYAANVRCYWLIKSPEGTAINIQFVDQFMHGEFCKDEDLPHLPCVDFVEVRFTDNLGITGGRFCCKWHASDLQEPISTHSNHTLILFKTYSNGTGGIKVNLTIEGCGGCQNDNTKKQDSCFRKITQPCYQTWAETVKLNSCSWWSQICDSRYRLQHVHRLSQCYYEQAYCCDGYTLSNDGKSCLIDLEEQTVAEMTTYGSDADNIDSSNTESHVESDQGTGWSSWSSWSVCSVPCGGCGTQTRSRTCLSVTCTGDTSESKPCGEEECDKTVRVCASQRSYVQTVPCGLMGEICYKNQLKTVYYTYYTSCCCGYEVIDGVCKPSS